jgi:shikimate dehydrogenase
MRTCTAIIGHPVAHSLSPCFQQAAFDGCGIDAAYVPIDLDPSRAEEALFFLKDFGVSGFNVTLPFKELAYRKVDQVFGVASKIRSVNTVVARGGAWEGYNTDVPGFLKAYSRFLTKTGAEGENFLVLGAGGSARAILEALSSMDASHIKVVNRSEERVKTLLQEHSGGGHISMNALPELKTSLDGRSWHVINTLSRNAFPVRGAFPPLESIDEDCVASVFDLSYEREGDTECVAWAKRKGIPSSDGLSMLLFQGALSFEIWTGRAAPVQKMVEAIVKALPNRKDLFNQFSD